MTPEEREELRSFYIKEYKAKTGYNLTCIERMRLSPTMCKSACLQNIVKLSSEYTKIPEADIVKKCRKRHLVDIRRMMAAVMREYRLTYEQITGVFGHSDHTTVLFAVNSHKEIYSVDREYREDYKMYKKYIRQKVLQIHSLGIRTKITQQMKESIIGERKEGASTKDLANKYQLNRRTVQKIVAGKY